jgi:uncharacterized iron-regulated protein
MSGKRLKVMVALLLAGILTGVVAAGSASPDRVLRLADGAVIDYAGLLQELQGTRVVIVGENHDQVAHHDLQLAVIQSLRATGRPLAIGVEMFTAEGQRGLDRWVAGKIPEAEFEQLFAREWQEPWPLYREIFRYARDQRIPMVGLNIPRDVIRRVAVNGFASLPEDEQGKLPPGITCDLTSDYVAFIRRIFASHKASDRAFLYFCEAQMVWNKGMAWHLARYLRQNPDRTVVALLGVAHALKRGVPENLEQEGVSGVRVVLPELSDLSRMRASAEDADYLVLRP